MPVTTQDVLNKAHELGDLIAQHPAAKKMEDILKRLQDDTDAQRAMNDYNRHLQALSEKEAAGKPIEVEDKRKLEALQNAVIRNPILRDFQVGQMDYLDLMRKVDEAIQGGPDPAPTPGSSRTGDAITPDFSQFT
jgi:cell fate (sporulation/competence/biofilm development) regulator YlbF (YheA/YmcA/DUF963 family)